MLGANAGASALWLVRAGRAGSPLGAAEDKAEEPMRLVSPGVRKPFRADRRGLFTPRGQATGGAEPPGITGGGALDAPWDVGVRGRGRPANTEDREAELGLLVEAAVQVAQKGRPAKGTAVQAKVSLGAAGARGAGVA